MLTDSSEEAFLRVVNSTGTLTRAFFLQASSSNTVSADLHFEQPTHSELLPAGATQEGGFRARLAVQQAGKYRVIARIHSTYGSIETYLGDTTVRYVPVTLPDQEVVAVFDPLPRFLFASRLFLRSELPTGVVRLSFSSSQEARAQPDQLTLSSGQPQTITISESGPIDSVQALDYTAVWKDGSVAAQRKGILHILVKQMSLVEFLRAKWPWLAGVAILLLALFRLIAILCPHPIRGSLVVLFNGTQICRLELPKQGKRTSLKVRESPSGSGLSGRIFAVRGDQDRDLFELRSSRRGGRWRVYATPREAMLYDVRGPASAANPLSEIRNPHFKTKDGRILVRFLP
jgi:hypothetical protein